jgi:hypothetical protein
MSRIFAVALAALAVAACNDSPISRELGARCDVTADCAQRCLSPSTESPGGFCTTSCTTSADCPMDASCADRQGGVCLFTCTTDPQCAFLGTGWTCQSSDASGGGKVMVCRGD